MIGKIHHSDYFTIKFNRIEWKLYYTEGVGIFGTIGILTDL
jgi:hypothetical protein